MKKYNNNNTKDIAYQSRKYFITINNPIKYGFTFEKVKEYISSLKDIDYWCYSEEVGQNGTVHIHIFIYRKKSALRFDTLKKLFPVANIKKTTGTCQANRDYIFKEGKQSNGKKSSTNNRISHYESAILPEEKQGMRTDMIFLRELIKAGKSNVEIYDENANFIRYSETIERIRQDYRRAAQENEFRNLEVTYIYGKSRTGKTSYVMNTYKYKNVHHITNYKNPFDSYNGQEVMLFDEFRDSLPLADMLNYLDGYPINLPARYNDRCALYTKVFIISNIPLEHQYINIQNYESESYNAFLNRIGKYYEMTNEGLTELTKPYINYSDDDWLL